MNNTEEIIKKCAASAQSRIELWIEFIRAVQSETMAEVGVYRGDFAAKILAECKSLQKYYLIDPWKHLEDWNKPANKSDEVFEGFLAETRSKTDFAADKRVILRGRTTEVIEDIPDDSLDFAYIDGDHTLRGISVDLIRVHPKVRAGGFIGGDDLSRAAWQHRTCFEPTMVFPFAVYFAEAVGSRIYALPHDQFLMEKTNDRRFSFIDLTGRYTDLSLRGQFHPDELLKIKIAEMLPRRVVNLFRKWKRTTPDL
ncbi:MAG TPA: class I SAM-dependent methyltransferase [Verrucomicrobiae bacterium]